MEGDPHHAGVQVRLSSDLESGEPPARRLWPAGTRQLGDDIAAGAAAVIGVFPWRGRRLLVGGEDRGPADAEQRLSMRDYGRFGSFRRFTIPPKGSVGMQLRFSFEATKDELVDADFRALCPRVLPSALDVKLLP